MTRRTAPSMTTIAIAYLLASALALALMVMGFGQERGISSSQAAPVPTTLSPRSYLQPVLPYVFA